MEKEFKKYTDLEVWKESRKLASTIYTATQSFPKEELFGLTSQMRPCAISVPSNIAEGCGRFHKKESLHFFFIARGSVYELETQLYLASDLHFLSDTGLQIILKQLELVRKYLNGFIRYYNRAENPTTHNSELTT